MVVTWSAIPVPAPSTPTSTACSSSPAELSSESTPECHVYFNWFYDTCSRDRHLNEVTV